MARLLCCLLILIPVLTVHPCGPADTWSPPAVEDDLFAGGSGTLEDPYLVATADHLNRVRKHLDKHFRQVEDIDLADRENLRNWEPVGTYHGEGSRENLPFSGTYDGNGYVITNLHIEHTPEGTGLFALTGEDAVLRDIHLENACVKGQRRVGALVGCNRGTITECSVGGKVSGTEFVGGLVGDQRHGTIRDSLSQAVVSGKEAVGGLAGYNLGGTITGCLAAGDLRGERRIGGLIGRNSYGGKVVENRATGDVAGTSMVGGLVGSNYEGAIAKSSSLGRVSGTEKVGGLVGGDVDGEISSGHAQGEVSGEKYVGGLVGWRRTVFRGSISKSQAESEVTASDYAGGLIGWSEGGIIRESLARGSVSGHETAGGLVGLNIQGKIAKSYALGRVVGARRIGGLVGDNRGIVEECYAAGYVEGTLGTGGLIGSNVGLAERSYYDRETTGQSDIGRGKPKTTREMKKKNTFETWDFEAIWTVDEGQHYPHLQWQ